MVGCIEVFVCLNCSEAEDWKVKKIWKILATLIQFDIIFDPIWIKIVQRT